MRSDCSRSTSAAGRRLRPAVRPGDSPRRRRPAAASVLRRRAACRSSAMNRRKSSSVTTAGSISTPFRIRRTSSNATTLLGFVMARVSRLLQKAIGQTLCSLTTACGSSVSTRGSIFSARQVDEVDARVSLARGEPFGKRPPSGQRHVGCSAEHLLEVGPLRARRTTSASIATTVAVRGLPVSSAISPNICPGPSSASMNSIPEPGSLRRTATRPDRIEERGIAAAPSRTMMDCGANSRRRIRCSSLAQSAGDRPANNGTSLSDETLGTTGPFVLEGSTGFELPATRMRGRQPARHHGPITLLQPAAAPLYDVRPMANILQHLPSGQKVGIAFSGGLDTSAALHWMRAKGAIPYAYTANLGQPDEPDYDEIPRRALQYGAEKARLDRLPHAARRRRTRGAPVRRLPYLHGRRPVLQHDADRPRRHRNDARCRHEGRRRQHLGRRQHLQGQRHRAVLPLRPARQSRAFEIYKPWLDQAFIDELGGRAEMSEYMRRRASSTR